MGGYAMNIEIANRLYEFRKKHHLSQEELAEKIGVSRQAVSKWERAEASPDTDNLILLAKVYGVTLDELLMGSTAVREEEKKFGRTEETPTEEEPEEATEFTESTTDTGCDHISFDNGIHVESQNGDKVHVGWDGIYVHDKKGGRVSIDKNGIFVEEDGHVFTEEEMKHWKKEPQKKSIWYIFPYYLFVTIGFLIWGFLGGWHISWILFLTIPLYYSLVDAIYKKNPNHFAYPVLAATVYLWVGIEMGIWHPTWILFVTIPLYYAVCDMFKRWR